MDSIQVAQRELERIRQLLEGLSGEAYLWRAEELLAEAGFIYTATHCTCAHEGEYGHDFDCGYTYRPEMAVTALGTYEPTEQDIEAYKADQAEADAMNWRFQHNEKEL